jgi:DNA repair protein RecN (Recombination protein N)
MHKIPSSREQERLAWQIGELDKLAPALDESEELNAQHTRSSHAQALIDAGRSALTALWDGDESLIREQTPIR